MPPGVKPVFGNSPCLQSRWGPNYFRRLYEFHRASGFTMLEHDGSYPGDPCAGTDHPGHHGLADSRWNQWRAIADFYQWCRGRGLYLNVPDHYFLAGSSKTGMGYREVNWSLPREQQVSHTRQNIWDGTWQKLPSMGWMFVPLTKYHGGGAAATIEPLDQHLDHYRRMLESNLALGVQACYRGPRLFDTERTKVMVKSMVEWFKTHRDILESDLIHGRRAAARDLDWMLHVNPRLREKGMLVVFNPLNEPRASTLRVNLYYTGRTGTVRIRERSHPAKRFKLARDYTVEIPVSVPAQGMNWFVVEYPRSRMRRRRRGVWPPEGRVHYLRPCVPLALQGSVAPRRGQGRARGTSVVRRFLRGAPRLGCPRSHGRCSGDAEPTANGLGEPFDVPNRVHGVKRQAEETARRSAEVTNEGREDAGCKQRVAHAASLGSGLRHDRRDGRQRMIRDGRMPRQQLVQATGRLLQTPHPLWFRAQHGGRRADARSHGQRYRRCTHIRRRAAPQFLQNRRGSEDRAATHAERFGQADCKQHAFVLDSVMRRRAAATRTGRSRAVSVVHQHPAAAWQSREIVGQRRQPSAGAEDAIGEQERARLAAQRPYRSAQHPQAAVWKRP